jgi:hypothetical protein
MVCVFWCVNPEREDEGESVSQSRVRWTMNTLTIDYAGDALLVPAVSDISTKQRISVNRAGSCRIVEWAVAFKL